MASVKKSPQAFRTISEVARWLETPAHVLRFWESRFDKIAPVKGAGGRRYYRPEDMQLLGGIKHLLHTDGRTIKAVQELLASEGAAAVAAHCALPADGDADPSSAPAPTAEAAQPDIPAKPALPHRAEAKVPAPAKPAPDTGQQRISGGFYFDDTTEDLDPAPAPAAPASAPTAAPDLAAALAAMPPIDLIPDDPEDPSGPVLPAFSADLRGLDPTDPQVLRGRDAIARFVARLESLVSPSA